MNPWFAIRRTLHTGRRWLRRHLWKSTETPHRLALGVAIGLFVGFSPTFGLQMGIAFLLAWLLGGNKILAVGFVWISNPFTFVPIYYPGYWLGCWILGQPVREQFWIRLEHQLEWTERALVFYEIGMKIFKPLWIGSLILGGGAGILGYMIIRGIFWWYTKTVPEEQGR